MDTDGHGFEKGFYANCANWHEWKPARLGLRRQSAAVTAFSGGRCQLENEPARCVRKRRGASLPAAVQISPSSSAVVSFLF
jgi:hypothetical protein